MLHEKRLSSLYVLPPDAIYVASIPDLTVELKTLSRSISQPWRGIPHPIHTPLTPGRVCPLSEKNRSRATERISSLHLRSLKMFLIC